MLYHSKEHIDAILRLEQECNALEAIPYKAGIEHLAKENGDHGILCYQNNKMIGLLSWYAADGSTARIDARVHPHYRRQGALRRMLLRALEDIAALGIRRLSYRMPRGSQAGIAAADSLGVTYERSEYVMTLRSSARTGLGATDIRLRPGLPEDFEFMVACVSQAFGDSESWTREYLTGTNDPSRLTYVAWKNGERVGLIRVNRLDEHTVVIHDFCVLPSLQGMGLGAQILGQAVELLLADSCREIRLGVVTDNERALNLYLRAGFEITAENLYFIGGLG
jgi:Acetyltransferases